MLTERRIQKPFRPLATQFPMKPSDSVLGILSVATVFLERHPTCATGQNATSRGGQLLAQSGHQLLGSRSTLNALTRPAARSIGHLLFRFDTEFLNDLACGCKLGFQKAFWSALFNPDTQFAPDSPKSPDEGTSGHHRSIDGRSFPPGRST
jgi:hypothetical protein